MNNNFGFRKICLSPEWMSAVDNTLPPTNMYLFLKTNACNIDQSDFLEPNSSFYFTKRSLIVNINFIYKEKEDSLHNCCTNLTVFEDEHKTKRELDIIENECVDINDENSDCEWYQANVVLKGFKEGFVNKTPLSQLW